MSEEPAPADIPVLDLGPYFDGREGALEVLAGELRHALEKVGFYYIRNHGVPDRVIAATFAAAKRFHDLPLEAKLAVRINEHNLGYLPLRGSTIRHSDLAKDNKPDLAAGFFVKRELPPDHPDVVSNRKFRGLNRWPAELPGFRETVLAYADALETLGLRLLPIYARALDLRPDFFAEAFRDAQFSLRLSHYPEQETTDERQFGVAPHTDTGFMTLLAQNDVPGLSIGLQDGRWIDAPVIPGTFIVNGGDMLRRWTNDRFLATPHRVINRSGRERYSIPMFFDMNLSYPIACLPTCTSPGNPPRYPPTTLMEYLTWQQRRNYDVLNAAAAKPAA
jgi:isopenicillin N synthase-like dioxygenase